MKSIYSFAVASPIVTTPLPHVNANNGTLSKVSTIVFTLTTLIAVIIIVIAGLRYILARGDPNATAQARNTLIYAVVGLIITMVAYGIVSFVLKGIS